MGFNADVIVVGSGPSGLSVTLPMLRAGMRVLLLDGGKQRDVELPSASYHRTRRDDPEQWKLFLGRGLESLRAAGPPSPKFDAPVSRFAFEASPESVGVTTRNFAAIVSLACGGLSNIWGAGVAAYGDFELRKFPFAPEELAPSYREVARRIGVTGFGGDDLDGGADRLIDAAPPLELCVNAAELLERYERRRERVHREGMRLGRARAALLTEARGARGACVRCDMCVWGCRVGAIYSSEFDLRQVRDEPNLSYRPGVCVDRLQVVDGGHAVAAAGESWSAPIVVLAAGALVTTKLVFALRDRVGERVPVVGAPGLGFALAMPSRLGASVSEADYSMGQLSFQLNENGLPPEEAVYGTLFAGSGLPATMVVDRMPLTRPAAIALYRLLQPALLFGNCFFPGHYGESEGWFERDASGERFVVEGKIADRFHGRLGGLKRQLGRAFRRLGARLLPGSLSTIGPGQDVRYAATLPMRADPGPGETDRFGELHGSPGLHVVDLSIFPEMPAKHHTLTLMANADRIGKELARRHAAARR